MYTQLMTSGKWKQYYYGAIASLSYTICGAAYVWVNPILELLLSKKSPIPMTAQQSSMIVALPEFGSVISPLASSLLADAFGRRSVLLSSAVFQVISWLGIFFTHNVYVIYAVRFFQGLILGTVSTVLPMYLSEICDHSRRGKVSVLYTIGWNIGLLLEYVAGPFIEYYSLIWYNIALPIIFILLFYFSYETPYFFMLHGDKIEAKRALASYRDEGAVLDEELAALESSLKRETAVAASWRDLWGTKKGRHALTITLVTAIAYYASGSMTVISYSDESFHKITGQSSFADSFTIAMGAILVVTPIATMLTIDNWGRRPLLILSYLGSLICFTPALIYFVLSDLLKKDSQALQVVAVVGLSLQIPVLTAGAMSVTHLYQAELFTTTTRSLASGLVTFIGAIVCIGILLPYYSLETAGLNIVNYGIYAFFSLVGLVYSIMCVPETKGLTFDEIQDLL